MNVTDVRSAGRRWVRDRSRLNSHEAKITYQRDDERQVLLTLPSGTKKLAFGLSLSVLPSVGCFIGEAHEPPGSSKVLQSQEHAALL